MTDEGHTYRGHRRDPPRGLRPLGVEYTYTVELTAGAARIDEQRWIATNHLEGDFPGGVVDLDFRFTLRGDRIAELVIAP